MIIFKKIKWKNFLSTGNTFVEIDLRKSQLTLMIGANGSGKSTMLDALCFALFNRPFRNIKKEQIVNTINNGDSIVEVEFEVGTKQYLIRRGIKPNLFEIYQNDKLINQDASNIDYQKYLEQNRDKIKKMKQDNTFDTCRVNDLLNLPMNVSNALLINEIYDMGSLMKLTIIGF